MRSKWLALLPLAAASPLPAQYLKTPLPDAVFIAPSSNIDRYNVDAAMEVTNRHPAYRRIDDAVRAGRCDRAQALTRASFGEAAATRIASFCAERTRVGAP